MHVFYILIISLNHSLYAIIRVAFPAITKRSVNVGTMLAHRLRR